ncbi:MAG: 30S ribosomal protein S12 methylthiotransferase RimO [Bacillota bacterium]|nr:30S ribosomal protein S12 methylthiotransferase RimO [Bacillota bacterium]
MKLYIDTLGCPKNSVDSENAAGLAEAAGHVIVEDPREAEVLLVNTCGFINDAKEESIDHILALAHYREQGKILAVSGCLSQRYGAELQKAMPEIDLLLGVNDYCRLPELLGRLEEEQRRRGSGTPCPTGEKAPGFPLVCLSPAPAGYEETGARKVLGPSYTAYLRIAEGCDNVCAYCVIPQIRGPYRSRGREDILREAEALAAGGCRELVVVAQDVTAYGMDRKDGYGLPELLTELCAVEGIRWIRLMYCYEDRITDKLIETMAREPKICHYIDIPIQHVSDRLLSAMNRRSTGASIRDTVARLRKAMPDVCIRTTLIVGLPGETPEEFAELEEFVETVKFQRLGVFAYSKEEGTTAAAMKGQLRRQTKERRRERIMALQQRISLENNLSLVGKTLEVLVEGREEEGTWVGRSVYDAPEIDNGVIFTSEEELAPGDLVQVLITDAYDYDLAGRRACDKEETIR